MKLKRVRSCVVNRAAEALGGAGCGGEAGPARGWAAGDTGERHVSWRYGRCEAVRRLTSAGGRGSAGPQELSNSWAKSNVPASPKNRGIEIVTASKRRRFVLVCSCLGPISGCRGFHGGSGWGGDLSAIRERIVTLHRPLSRGRAAAAVCTRQQLGQGVRKHLPP